VKHFPEYLYLLHIPFTKSWSFWHTWGDKDFLYYWHWSCTIYTWKCTEKINTPELYMVHIYQNSIGIKYTFIKQNTQSWHFKITHIVIFNGHIIIHSTVLIFLLFIHSRNTCRFIWLRSFIIKDLKILLKSFIIKLRDNIKHFQYCKRKNSGTNYWALKAYNSYLLKNTKNLGFVFFHSAF
jgi:hypothetical protein